MAVDVQNFEGSKEELNLFDFLANAKIMILKTDGISVLNIINKQHYVYFRCGLAQHFKQTVKVKS